MKTKDMNVTASALPSLAKCPRFVGQEEAGPAAEFGSAFHKAMELGDIAHALTPAALKACREGQGFSQKDIEEAYHWAQDWLAALREQYKPEAESLEFETNLEMIPGRRMLIDHLFCIDDSKYIVLDWKTGRSMYNAEENLQGKAYALALFQEDVDIDQVMVCFVTPFTKGQSTAIFLRENSDKLALEIHGIVTKAFDPNSLPIPGDACKYCGKFGRCESVAELTKPEEVEGWLESAKRSPEMMSALLDLCPVLDKLTKEIKAAASKMRFDDGLDIPGYTVTHTASKSKVTEVGQVVKYLTSRLGLEEKDILPYCSVSVSELESIIASTAKRGDKEAVINQTMSDLRARGYVTGGDGEGTPYLRKVK